MHVKANDKTISIHAPTRGATYVAIQFTFVKLFQSTLPRGERQHLLSVTKLIIYFNPRSHEGSDLHPTKNSGAGWIISIHAPTRGATVKNRFGLTDGKFQSTLPRGERRRKWKVFLVCIYFNPRSHEGSDLYALNLISIYMRISIHAPTRGATATLTNFFFYNQSIFC